MEEAPFAPPTTPDRPRSNQDAPAPSRARAQMQTQYKSQPMVRTQTHRNPRQGARGLVRGEAQTATVINGVPIRPALAQAQTRPQLQPRQNVVANAHNRVPRPAANGGRRLLLEFEYRNGWFICRNPETGAHFVIHEWTVVVSTLSMRLCLSLTENCGFVSPVTTSFFVGRSGHRLTDKIIGDARNHGLSGESGAGPLGFSSAVLHHDPVLIWHGYEERLKNVSNPMP